MTRAGVLLTALLAAASVGVFAQDSRQSASAPPQVSSQEVQPSATNSKAQENSPAPAASQTAQQPAGGSTSSVDTKSSGEIDSEMPTRQLPQTSTILPLLGLIGLGSLVAGLFARR